MRFWQFGGAVCVAVLGTTMGCVDPGTEPEPVPGERVFDLVYESFVGSQILLLPIDSGQPFPPTLGVAGGFDPDVSLDSRLLAYAIIGPGNAGDLVVVDLALANVDRLTNDTNFDEQPVFSPDGQRLAFTSNRDGSQDIHVIARSGGSRQRLTTDAAVDRSPAWSPDGARIAFASNRSGQMKIYTMNTSGGDVRRLTSTTGFEDDPAWSPDSRRIVFFEVAADSTSALVIVNADGSNREVLALPPIGVPRTPAWSPDGKLIAFTMIPRDGTTPTIYTIAPDGSDLRERTRDSQNRGGRSPTWILRQ